MFSGYEIVLVLKILLAFCFGSLVGFDRERSGKAAGIRTQMLICVGSALLAGISINLADKLSIPYIARPDPAHLMAQIVVGIGFVGAGVIIKSNHRVTGVTTAATLWTTAAIGIAIGSGFYLAAFTTLILVLLLEPLGKLQFIFGLKTYTYVLKIQKHYWDETIKLLKEIKIKYVIESSEEIDGHLVLYSSGEKKKKLTDLLESKQIRFDVIDMEE